MKLFVSVAKKLGYLAAGLIILAAMFVSLSIIVTPILAKHLTDIEKWTSQLLSLPVTIQHADLSWYRYQPVISMKAVTLKDKDTLKPVLQIKKVLVFFSIPKTIWQGKPVPSGILISGANLNVRESAKEQFTLQGFPLPGTSVVPYNQEATLPKMLGWLIVQPRIILENINIHYKGLKGPARFVTLYQLSLTNSKDAHVILGKAILHQQLATEVTVAIRWLGSELDLTKIKAKIYLYVSGLSLSQWLAKAAWNGWQVKQGVVSAKIWANWHLGQFHNIQSIFKIYQLFLFSQVDQATHKIDRFSGHLGWQLNEKTNEQIFAGDDLLIDFPGHLWPVSNFYLTLRPNQTNEYLVPQLLNIGYVNIQDIQQFIFASSDTYLPPEIKTILTKLNITGSLQNTAITFPQVLNDWRNLAIDSQFEKISFAAYAAYPGIKNFSGILRWHKDEGSLTLSSKRVEITYANIFSRPIFLDQIDGEVKIQRQTSAPDNKDVKDTSSLQIKIPAGQKDLAEGSKQISTLENEPTAEKQSWFFTVPKIHIVNADILADVAGKVTLNSKSQTIFDMSANLSMQQINNIARYLPAKLFEKKLTDWLTAAFLSGEIKSAHVILQGAMEDFPFDHQNGRFIANVDVNNVDLLYAEGWPILKQINGKISFIGRRMEVNLAQAKIFDMMLANVQAVIPDLADEKQTILQVKSAPISLDFSQGLNFIRQSPLQKKFGKMLSGMEAAGPIKLMLGLDLPLNDPDSTRVRGEISLLNDKLKLVPWNLTLTNMNGLLDFTEDSISANNIHTELFAKPITFKLATIANQQNNSITEISSDLPLSMHDLEKWLKIPFSKYATGETNVNMIIDLSMNEPMQIHLKSNLVGLTLNFGELLAKKPEEAKEFSADIVNEEAKTLRINLHYTKEVNAALVLNKVNNEFNLVGASLHLGLGNAQWPEEHGLYISGNFATLDLDKFLNDLGGANKQSSNPLSLPLQRIDIKANSFILAGLKLTKVQIEADAIHDNWEIKIASNEIKGEVKVPTNLNRQGMIVALFDKLSLISGELKTDTFHFDTKNLPAIFLIANNVNYNDMELGKVTFKTSLSNDGQNINTLKIISPSMYLQAHGNWAQAPSSNVTHLQGQASSKQVSELLDNLGFDIQSVLFGTGKINFYLTWDGPPYSPNLSTLKGNARLELGPGRIIEVGENNAQLELGRMLSIFSLQSLPRRLVLDFRDVFEKGYSFNKIFGDFIFRNGNVFTSNLYLDGPVARVGINGRIGIKNKDYDLILSVTPYVTSAIPVAATLLTGQPLIGLAAFAVNSMIDASRAATYYYSVKGPWSHPIWSSVKGK